MSGTQLDLLRQRMTCGAATRDKPTKARCERVQKNLSIVVGDAARLKSLATRDGLSQAQLIKHALDAYEARHGKLAATEG